MKNKNIVITGGAGLIGSNFSRALINSGSNIIIADCNYDKAHDLAETLNFNANGTYAKAIAYDATSAESTQCLLQDSIQALGRVDTLINNIYIKNDTYGEDLLSVTLASFNENLSSNVGAYFESSKVFGKYFSEEENGNIINIASIYGTNAPDFDLYEGTEMTMPVEYSAIKSAIIHLTKYMAKYFKGKGIRVNCISPGGILDNQPKEFLNRYRNKCLNKGMLDTDDLVGTLLFLVSEQSRYINGQNIIVDDGFSI
jgi:NAD(P)-dependent dehydrogenase (short-subunit alcohol dehydrogenase family)